MHHGLMPCGAVRANRNGDQIPVKIEKKFKQ